MIIHCKLHWVIPKFFRLMLNVHIFFTVFYWFWFVSVTHHDTQVLITIVFAHEFHSIKHRWGNTIFKAFSMWLYKCISHECNISCLFARGIERIVKVFVAKHSFLFFKKKLLFDIIFSLNTVIMSANAKSHSILYCSQIIFYIAVVVIVHDYVTVSVPDKTSQSFFPVAYSILAIRSCFVMKTVILNHTFVNLPYN